MGWSVGRKKERWEGREVEGGMEGGKNNGMERIMIGRKKNRGMKDWRIQEKSMKYFRV